MIPTDDFRGPYGEPYEVWMARLREDWEAGADERLMAEWDADAMRLGREEP